MENIDLIAHDHDSRYCSCHLWIVHILQFFTMIMYTELNSL